MSLFLSNRLWHLPSSDIIISGTENPHGVNAARMPALNLNEDSTGRMVFKPSLFSRLGGLFSTLVWLGFLLVFLLPSFGGGRFDPESLLPILFVLVFVVGGGLLGALLTNQVVIDQPSRTVTSSRRLLGFPINTLAVPFGDIANVEYQYYRQSSGRTSHNAWRVNLLTRDNRRIPINWDGKQDEMAALAQKVAALTGGQLVDNSTRPVSTAQQILDSMRGRTDLPAPAEQETEPQEATPQSTAPSMPETQAPPPVAAPWLMPEGQTTLPTEAPASEPMMETVGGEETTGEVTASDLRNMSVADLEERIKSDPMEGLARHVLARKYQEGGQLDRAAALYQQVLHIDPTNADAQNDLGVALERQRKRTEAEAAYRRAVALDPFSSRAHLNLGLLLRSMNRATEASQEFFQARQNAHDDSESRLAEAASTGSKLEPQLSNIFQ